MGDAWRLLLDEGGDAGWNMALDEALLASAEPRPTLRLYTWAPGALSLGYFQRWEDLAPLARGGLPVVRRLTGGGAIHHAGELTFSIAADDACPLYRGEVRASYERVHAALAAALLRAAGVQAALRGDRRVYSDVAGSPMCFHRSTDLDLVWDGAKGVGSAQRRKAGRVLHHGSIKLDSTPLEGPVATLRQHAPGLSTKRLGAVLLEVFAERLGARFEAEAPAASELARAQGRRAFFTSPGFVRERRDPERARGAAAGSAGEGTSGPPEEPG